MKTAIERVEWKGAFADVKSDFAMIRWLQSRCESEDELYFWARVHTEFALLAYDWDLLDKRS